MSLALVTRAAHAAADALDRIRPRIAGASTAAAPHLTDQQLADMVRRGLTPQLLDALRKALKV